MKKAKLSMLIMVAMAAMVNMGCSKDNPLNPVGGCSGNASWVEVLTNESTAYGEALTAYDDDPTDANCSNLKTAGKNYLDALRNVAQCVPTVSQAQYDEAINEAKADIDENGCN